MTSTEERKYIALERERGLRNLGQLGFLYMPEIGFALRDLLYRFEK